MTRVPKHPAFNVINFCIYNLKNSYSDKPYTIGKNIID